MIVYTAIHVLVTRERMKGRPMFVIQITTFQGSQGPQYSVRYLNGNSNQQMKIRVEGRLAVNCSCIQILEKEDSYSGDPVHVIIIGTY